MADHPESPFFLSDYLVEPSLNRISGAGRDERVPLKMMQVLLVLAERPGSVVERDELMDRVWGDTIVEEAVLTRAVSDLRKVFDDSAREQSVIETIPKVGYRLVAPVQPATGGDSQADFSDGRRTGLPSSFDITVRAPDGSLAGSAAGSLPGALRWLPLAAIPIAVAAVFWMAGRADTSGSPASAPMPLTAMTGAEFEPAVSPDGGRVAFSRAEDGSGNVDLYVIDRTGSGLQRLTDHADRDVGAAWSPDGLRIAFLRKGEGACSIHAVPAGGGPDTRLAECRIPANDNLDWSPDGRLLAYSARPSAEESFSIFLIDVQTGEERRLSRPTGQHWGDRFPKFSPDGSTVAFSRSLSMATQDVFAIDVESGEERAVTADHRAVLGLDWSADGRSLLVATDRSGVNGLWRMPIDGSDPEWIARAGSGVRQPSAASAVASVVYMQETDVSEIMRFDPVSGRSTAAAGLTSSRFDAQPAYSPDGTQVAFSSNRSGTQEIWVGSGGPIPGSATADGSTGPAPAEEGVPAVSEARRLTSLAAGFTGAPAWSPDGRRIAFDARPNGQPDIYVVDAAGGVPVRVTRSAAGDFSPTYSADGRTLFFGSNRSGEWQIWGIDPGGGEAVQVTTEGGFAVQAAVIAGSRVLLHTRYDSAGLWMIPEAGGEAVRLSLPGALIDHDSFTARNGMVYAVISDGRIARVDPSDGSFEFIETGEAVSRKMGISVAPDGTILFGRRGPATSDLMLLEL